MGGTRGMPCNPVTGLQGTIIFETQNNAEHATTVLCLESISIKFLHHNINSELLLLRSALIDCLPNWENCRRLRQCLSQKCLKRVPN